MAWIQDKMNATSKGLRYQEGRAQKGGLSLRQAGPVMSPSSLYKGIPRRPSRGVSTSSLPASIVHLVLPQTGSTWECAALCAAS